MTAPAFHLVVPGSLHQRTGGYLYDARIVEELGAVGDTVRVHEVDGRFPDVDAPSLQRLDSALGDIPDDALTVVDGLGLGAAPSVVEAHAGRLRLLALVHHPLADETGLDDAARARLEASEREALRHVRGVVVTSPYTARRLDGYGVPASRIRAVLPGTDPAPMADGTPPGEPIRMVCVGTVTPRKGHDVLVAALATLTDLPWRCDCAGSLDRAPDFVEKVRAEAERKDLVERMRFLGELQADVLDEVYRTATIFVLPSHYEGYGMAFAEALARGLPVVGTTGGAIPFTVPDDAGLLVEPGDVEALAAALRELLENEGRREELAEAARAHARELPGWPRQAEAFLEAVGELASVQRSASGGAVD